MKQRNSAQMCVGTFKERDQEDGQNTVHWLPTGKPARGGQKQLWWGIHSDRRIGRNWSV